MTSERLTPSRWLLLEGATNSAQTLKENLERMLEDAMGLSDRREILDLVVRFVDVGTEADPEIALVLGLKLDFQGENAFTRSFDFDFDLASDLGPLSFEAGSPQVKVTFGGKLSYIYAEKYIDALLFKSWCAIRSRAAKLKASEANCEPR